MPLTSRRRSGDSAEKKKNCSDEESSVCTNNRQRKERVVKRTRQQARGRNRVHKQQCYMGGVRRAKSRTRQMKAGLWPSDYIV